MYGFIKFIEKDGKYIGGYLKTDEELYPLEFAITDPITPPDNLQKILYGKQCDKKWFGDLIAGTLFESAKKEENADENEIEAFFVSDIKMLSLRSKTGKIPVAFIDDDGRIDLYSGYQEDLDAIRSILEKINQKSDLSELMSRVEKGIEEKLSSLT